MHRYDWSVVPQPAKNNDNAASTNKKFLLESPFNQQQIEAVE